MRIAIIGSTGYISKFLIDRFEGEKDVDSILKVGRTEKAALDLNQAELFDYNSLCGIDYVIFTAAVSSPDVCAQNYEESWKINVIGTTYFIQKAIDCGCKVVFFSSDAVYGDIPGEIYHEKSPTQANTAYGRMKKAVENLYMGHPQFKSLRLSYVVSQKDRFVSYCLSCMKRQVVADIFHPFYRNCIVVDDVVDTVVWLTKHWNETDFSVLNLAGRELVSRVRIADEINRYCNQRLQYTITEPDPKFYENRPRITQMESLYLYTNNIVEDKAFSEKFKRKLEDIKHD